jgi:phosphoinositide-3-kinase regulatory subunit 4
MVTSWQSLYLTDFASFKPVDLPADNPADFAYFFDTSGKRKCYIAPERFVGGQSYTELQKSKKLLLGNRRISELRASLVHFLSF